MFCVSHKEPNTKNKTKKAHIHASSIHIWLTLCACRNVHIVPVLVDKMELVRKMINDNLFILKDFVDGTVWAIDCKLGLFVALYAG